MIYPAVFLRLGCMMNTDCCRTAAEAQTHFVEPLETRKSVLRSFHKTEIRCLGLVHLLSCNFFLKCLITSWLERLEMFSSFAKLKFFQ